MNTNNETSPLREESKCTLSDSELIAKCQQWVHDLAESGGRKWSLRVPVDFNSDPDMLFLELCKRLQSQSLPAEQPEKEPELKDIVNAYNEKLFSDYKKAITPDNQQPSQPEGKTLEEKPFYTNSMDYNNDMMPMKARLTVNDWSKNAPEKELSPDMLKQLMTNMVSTPSNSEEGEQPMKRVKLSDGGGSIAIVDFEDDTVSFTNYGVVDKVQTLSFDDIKSIANSIQTTSPQEPVEQESLDFEIARIFNQAIQSRDMDFFEVWFNQQGYSLTKK